MKEIMKENEKAKAPTKQAEKSLTESDKIWEEIKDLPIAMFALPNQFVQQHVVRVEVEPSSLYLKGKSPAVIAGLDEALNTSFDRAGNITKTNMFNVEQAENGFIIVKRNK